MSLSRWKAGVALVTTCGAIAAAAGCTSILGALPDGTLANPSPDGSPNETDSAIPAEAAGAHDGATSVDGAPAPDALSPSSDGATGTDSAADTGAACMGTSCDDAGAIPPPQQVSPLSTALVTSQTPTFHWVLAAGTTGAQVDICGDRSCGILIQSFSATGTSGAPPTALSPGVTFWRLHGISGKTVGATTSFVWEVRVGARSAAVDTSWGTIVDPNGDGLADVLAGTNGTVVYLYSSTGTDGASPPQAGFSGPTKIAAQGSSVASAGDVNGDGYADVIIGAQTSGNAYVYLGSQNGLVTSSFTTLTAPSEVGGYATNYGGSVASAGDVNGDGYADVIVGDKRSENPSGVTYLGAAFIYLGGPSGISTSYATKIQGAGGFFGASVASAGDVNGDGYGDVIIGAYSNNVAYIYQGGKGGLAAALTTTDANTTFSGAAASNFGFSVAGADDLDGNGYADVAVGAPAGGGGNGGVSVFLGSMNGASTTAITPEPKNPSGNFGYSVAGAGDVNGDGYADLLVGAYENEEADLYEGSGTTVVPSGAFVGAVAEFGIAGAGTSNSEFGLWVAGLGDVDGNGLADVAVGALNNAAGADAAVDAYAMYIYFAPLSSGMTPIPLGAPAGGTLLCIE